MKIKLLELPSFWDSQVRYNAMSWISWLGWFRWSVEMSVSSVVQSCPTLCDPVDCSMPGLPVHHQLPELTQTHVNRVSDATQPCHPLSFPPPPAFNLSQHQGLLNESVLCIRGPKFWSFSFSSSPWFPLEFPGLISLQSKGLSWVFSNITIQKHQSFSAQLSLESNSHIHTWLLEKP